MSLKSAMRLMKARETFTMDVLEMMKHGILMMRNPAPNIHSLRDFLLLASVGDALQLLEHLTYGQR